MYSQYSTRGKNGKGRHMSFLCNLLEQVKLLYLKWKLYMSSFIWDIGAWSIPRGCRVMDQNVEGCWLTPAHQESRLKWANLYQDWNVATFNRNSKFIYPKMAQDLLFHMRYGSLICSKRWLSDRPKCRNMFLRLEGMIVLEWCENRGFLSLSGCHLAVSQS